MSYKIFGRGWLAQSGELSPGWGESMCGAPLQQPISLV